MPDMMKMKKGDVIIISGANTTVASYPAMGAGQQLAAVQDRGIKVVAVDPRCSETGTFARGDKENNVPGWVAVKPGGGGLIALGMLKALATDLVPGVGYDELSPSRQGGPEAGYGFNPQGFGIEEAAGSLFVSKLAADVNAGATTIFVALTGSGTSTYEKLSSLVGAQVGLDMGIEGKQEIVHVVAVGGPGKEVAITIAEPTLHAHAQGSEITEDLNLKDYVTGLPWGIITADSGVSKQTIINMAKMFFGAAKAGNAAVWESKRGDAMLSNGFHAIRAGLLLNCLVPANFKGKTLGAEGGWSFYYGGAVKSVPGMALHGSKGGDYYYFRLWLLEDAPSGTKTFKVGTAQAKTIEKLLKRPVKYYRKVALRTQVNTAELAQNLTLQSPYSAVEAFLLKAGSIIKAGSVIAKDSVVVNADDRKAIGGNYSDDKLGESQALGSDYTLTGDVLIREGTQLEKGTTLSAGTVIWGPRDKEGLKGTYKHGNGGTVESAIPVAVNTTAGTVTLDFGEGKGSRYFHKATTTVKWELPYLMHGILHHAYPLAKEQQTHHVFANIGKIYPAGVFMHQYCNWALSFPDNRDVVRALKDPKIIPYHIAIDIFMGDTSAYADIILPGESVLERWVYMTAPWMGRVRNVSIRQPVLFDINSARAGKFVNGVLFEGKDLREIYYDIINMINWDGTYTGPVERDGKPAGCNDGWNFGTRTYSFDKNGNILGWDDLGKVGPPDSNNLRYGHKNKGGNGTADPYGVIFWMKNGVRTAGALPADKESGFVGASHSIMDPDVGQLMFTTMGMPFADCVNDEKRFDYMRNYGVVYKVDADRLSKDHTLNKPVTLSGGVEASPGSRLTAGTTIAAGTLGHDSGTLTSDIMLKDVVVIAPGSTIAENSILKKDSSIWTEDDRKAIGGDYTPVNKFAIGPPTLTGTSGKYAEKEDLPGVPGNRTFSKANAKLQAFSVPAAGVPDPGQNPLTDLSREYGNTCYDGLPVYEPINVSLARPVDDLGLITFKASVFTKSRMACQPTLKEIMWENKLLINPVDAAARGLKTDDIAVVECHQRTPGTKTFRVEKVEPKVEVTEGIKPGVVGLCGIFGHEHNAGYILDGKPNRAKDMTTAEWPKSEKLPDAVASDYAGDYNWAINDGHQRTGVNTGAVIWSLTERYSGAANYHGTKVRVYKKQ